MAKQVASGQAAAEVQPSQPATKTVTTLLEQGPRLPIGFGAAGELLKKDFACRTIKTRDEKEIAKLKRPKMNIAAHVGAIIAHCFTKIGDTVWGDDVKPETRQVLLHTMYMADVFYLYCWLRYKTMGKKLPMNISCPSPQCGHKFVWTADIETLEVATVSDAAALTWEHELEEPFQLRGKRVTSLTIGSPRWNYIVSNAATMNEGSAKVGVVVASITGMNGLPDVMSVDESELDDMSKPDLETIADGINGRFVGPKMAVEGVCPECQAVFKQAIDWSYDNFFTTSSR